MARFVVSGQVDGIYDRDTFTSFGPRRWFVGIEPDFAAIGDGSPGIGEGARRSTQIYER